MPKGKHRQVKYLNNVVEAHHGKLKQLIRPVRGFNFEVMRALRKGQAALQPHARHACEARIVERAFGIGPCILAETMQFVTERMELTAA